MGIKCPNEQKFENIIIKETIQSEQIMDVNQKLDQISNVEEDQEFLKIKNDKNDFYNTGKSTDLSETEKVDLNDAIYYDDNEENECENNNELLLNLKDC